MVIKGGLKIFVVFTRLDIPNTEKNFAAPHFQLLAFSLNMVPEKEKFSRFDVLPSLKMKNFLK